MVEAAGAPDGPGALRPLNAPKQVRVEAAANGRPLTVTLGRRRLKVASVQDAWRVEDEWWRDVPVSRTYFQVQLKDGRTLTVFHDLVAKQWFLQRPE